MRIEPSLFLHPVDDGNVSGIEPMSIGGVLTFDNHTLTTGAENFRHGFEIGFGYSRFCAGGNAVAVLITKISWTPFIGRVEDAHVSAVIPKGQAAIVRYDLSGRAEIDANDFVGAFLVENALAVVDVQDQGVWEMQI